MSCKGCNYEKEYNEPWIHGHECGKVIVSKNVNTSDMSTIRERIITRPANPTYPDSEIFHTDKVVDVLQELSDRITVLEEYVNSKKD
mgnify:FL=1